MIGVENDILGRQDSRIVRVTGRLHPASMLRKWFPSGELPLLNPSPVELTQGLETKQYLIVDLARCAPEQSAGMMTFLAQTYHSTAAQVEAPWNEYGGALVERSNIIVLFLFFSQSEGGAS